MRDRAWFGVHRDGAWLLCAWRGRCLRGSAPSPPGPSDRSLAACLVPLHVWESPSRLPCSATSQFQDGNMANNQVLGRMQDGPHLHIPWVRESHARRGRTQRTRPQSAPPAPVRSCSPQPSRPVWPGRQCWRSGSSRSAARDHVADAPRSRPLPGC